METMRIETSLRHRNEIPVLDVIGEIDIYTTPQFKEAVSAAIDENRPKIVINMAQVTYMDSSGFGTLLSATKRLRPLDGALYLAGCNDSIQRMLQIHPFEHHFRCVYDGGGSPRRRRVPLRNDGGGLAAASRRRPSWPPHHRALGRVHTSRRETLPARSAGRDARASRPPSAAGL